ncbi:MAG: hypothetical protein ACRCY4_07245 [Brevinema sp.]
MRFNSSTILSILFASILSFSTIYGRVPSLDISIRGFTMGERYATILKTEQNLGEFTLTDNKSSNRLSYSGSVLGEQASIIYSFRAGRLVSLRYVWVFPTPKDLFSLGLIGLLEQKYQASGNKNITVPEGSAEYSLYADKQDPPTLLAELEVFKTAQDEQTVILEFRAPDADTVLIKKILTEDL